MLIDYHMESTLQRRHKRQNKNGLAPIQLRITIAGVRCDLSTGVFCPEAYWPIGSQRLVVPADKQARIEPEFSASIVKQLNDELFTFKNDVSNVYKQLRRPDPRGPLLPVTVEQVRLAVRQLPPEPIDPQPAKRHLLDVASTFIGTLRAAPVESRLTEATLLTYLTRYRVLARYLAAEKTLDLLAETVTIPWCRRYERWLMSEVGGFAAISMRKQINFLQMVLDFAVHEGWLNHKLLHGYSFQTRLVAPVVVSLPAQEVKRLVEALPDLDLPHRRAVIGWLFCCYTGLSWVDYRRFASRPADFLRMDNGQCWIRMVRQKMIRRKPQGFSVPLFEEAAELLMAHHGCLPQSHGANTNLLLHRVESALQLSCSLTTKLARATFSQAKRDAGYSDEAVAAMMGDTVNVMNKHYSNVSEKRISLEMAQLAGMPPMRKAA